MSRTTSTYLPFMLYADTLVAVQRRNVDTLTVASKIVADGFKAAAKQQGDRMRTTVERFVEIANQAATEPTALKPDEHLAEMKAVYLTALDDANAVTGLVFETQAEATKVVTQGVLANVGDLMASAKMA